MPQLFRANAIRVEGQEGDVHVHVTLDLNITLKTDGSLDIQANARSQGQQSVAAPQPGGDKPAVEPEQPERSPFVIPQFKKATKINFGKKEGE